MKKKGFTLIELIAVIAILAILAIIAVPRVISYVDKSKKVAVQAEAKIIYDAAERAYNEGILVPKPGINIVGESQKANFDYICVDSQDGVLQVLEKHNLISKANFEKDKTIFCQAYMLMNLKQIINSDLDKIKIDSNGQVVSWDKTK